MTELRAAALCFSLAETQTFLTQALGRPPVAEIVATLQTQTEGWIAGLHSLRGEINMLWSHVLSQPHELQLSLAVAQQALEQLPATHLYVRSRALICLGLTLQMTGRVALAVQTLQRALDEQAALPDTLPRPCRGDPQ